MTTQRLSTACFALVLATLTAPAFAQSTSFDIDVGYQSVEVDGNEDMFNTQINESDGVVIRNFSINYVDPSGDAGFADRLRIDASGFGGSPAGRFRLEMGLADAYRLSLYYQQFNSYSALPAFANPLLDDGVYTGQHTWDRDRDILDLRLELLPGGKVMPILGYRWNRYEGPGQSTYAVGADEFLIDTNIDETEQEFYVGLAFTTRFLQGTVLQGWREFDGTTSESLAPGAGGGNNSTNIAGQPINLDSFNRSSRNEAETPVTTVNLTGRINESARLVASYVRADYEGDTQMSEALTGSLASFELFRFFSGLDQSIESRTENPFWRGELRLDWDISRKVEMNIGYEARDRTLSGWTMISSLYSDTLNFGGFDPQDITTMVEAQTGYEREDSIASVRFDFRDLGAFSLWAEYAIADQDLDVTADVAEIVLPGGQEGQFSRKISSYDVGGTVKVGGLKILVDAAGQNADDIIMRTDFNDRFRLRGRIDWSLKQIFRVLLTAESIESDNNDSEVGYQADTDHYAVDLNLTPTDNFTLRAAYDTYNTDTEIPIRVPQSFEIEPSVYSEDGEMLEGGLMWKIAFFTVDASYSTYENSGSFPFELDRIFARLAFDLSKSISLAGEYENWDYKETDFSIADYNADRWAFFVRWRR